MVRSTILGRVADGLPLCASMDDDEDKEFAAFKQQAKSLLKRVSQMSDQRCSIESGPYFFHYLIEFGVCYLCVCDKNYPKKLAFSYLEELQREFQQLYGSEVDTVGRPYAFIKFETTLKKAKRSYQDTRAQKNLQKLNEDLQDVQRIMTKNISDVLGRGDRIDTKKDVIKSVIDMANLSSKLREESDKYGKLAKNLNLQAQLRKYGPPAIVAIVVLLFLYIYFRF